MNHYFEVTYRGLTAKVATAPALGRWEVRLTSGEWVPLSFQGFVGYFPAFSLDAARAAAVEFLKSEHPGALASAYLELDRLNRRIAELRADADPVFLNPVIA